MKRLKDYSKIGTIEDVRKTIKEQTSRLRTVGNVLFNRHDLGIGCRVYPEIARSTAEQLELLAKHIEEPIEITANICRTVFEINILLRYCISSTDRLNAYADQSGTDEISVYKAFKTLAHEDTNPKVLETLDLHINQVRSVLMKHGRNLKPERLSTYKMAKEVGQVDEYNSMYGIYSKYVHASAWFVLRKRDHIDLPVFRMLLQLHTQLYAGDTMGHLEELKDGTRHQPRK